LQGAHPVDFYVAIALELNPEIQAARRAVEAQAQVMPQVTALDDPMLSTTLMPISAYSLQTAAGRATSTLTLSQKLPWRGKLRVRGEVAEEELRMAQARLAQTQLEVVEDVRLAYHELLFSQRATDITREHRQLLEDLLQIADALYRTGETSQQDVLRAQVELDRLDDRLIGLRRAQQQAQADLASLLHTAPGAEPQALPEVAASPVPAQIEPLYERAARCRPRLQERAAAVAREQRREELARLQSFPDVTLGMSWQSMTTDRALSGVANGNDNLMLTVGANLPIWRARLRAGVSEAQQRVLESASRHAAARNDTFRQIRRLMVQARALDEQLQLFRENIIPHAEQTLQVSVADYRVGSVSFLQLIDNWTQLLAFEVQHARLEASREQALASLEAAVGCPLTGPAPSTDEESTD
jgi:outer membrane protein, heavy metal efflux system